MEWTIRGAFMGTNIWAPKATVQRCPALRGALLGAEFYLAPLSQPHVIFSVEPIKAATKFSSK